MEAYMTGKLDNHNHELYNHRALEKKWQEVVHGRMPSEKVTFPADLMTDFGFDALHLYCIYNPVPETNDDWDEEVVAAAYRFLKRFWALATASLRSECPASPEVRSIRNRLVRELTACRESGRSRTAPAFFMKACRELRGVAFREDCPTGSWTQTDDRIVDPGTIRDLVILLRDLAPVMAAELWSRIADLSVEDAPWPAAGSLAEEGDLFCLPVSVDGKVRAEVRLLATLSEEEIIEKGRQALAEKARRKGAGNPGIGRDAVFEKAVYIPFRILNFVSVKAKDKNDTLSE